MARFSTVLKNKNFLFLWLGQIIAQFGERMSQMALVGLVSAYSSGSSMQLAKTFSFTILPVFLIGPVAGAYVDRWDRRQTMLICDFLRAGLVLLIPLALFLHAPLNIIYLLIFLVFSVSRFFIPAKLSIIPELVNKEELLIANSLTNITAMIAAVLGFGIGGLLVESFGVSGGFRINGLGFFISGVFIFFIRKKKTHRLKIKELSRDIAEVIKKSVAQEIKEGIAYFIKQKKVKLTGAVLFFLGGALGVIYIVMISFIQTALHSVTKDLGFVVVFIGAGLFLGSLLYGRLGQRFSHFKVIFFSLILAGLALASFVLGLMRYPYLLNVACLATLLGLTASPIVISCTTLIHNSSHNEMMGRIFTFLEVLLHLGFIIFMFLSGYLVDRGMQPSRILLTLAVFLMGLGLVNLIFQRKISWLD